MSPRTEELPPQRRDVVKRRFSLRRVLFILFQVVIAVGAFALTRDYMSDGAFTQSARNLVLPGEGADWEQQPIATAKNEPPGSSPPASQSVIPYQKPEAKKPAVETIAKTPAPAVAAQDPVSALELEPEITAAPSPSPVEPIPLPDVVVAEPPLPPPVEPPPTLEIVAAEPPPLPPVVEPASAPAAVAETVTVTPPIELTPAPVHVEETPLPPPVEPTPAPIAAAKLSPPPPVALKPVVKVVAVASANIAVPAAIAHAKAIVLPKPVAPEPVTPAEAPVPKAPVEPPPVVVAETTASTTPAQQSEGEVFKDCADCPELVVVSAGNFTKVDEASSTATNIDHDFAIGRNGITFDDWDRCVDEGACKAIADDSGWGRGSRPLIFVSFDDVTTQYLPWLSRLSGKEYRLPTEDEWQYAALGGAGAAETKSQIGDASQDCFNATGPAAGNCPDTYNGTAPVGSFTPNALGLYDMKGNVWEWSADCWRPFSYAPNASSNTCDKRVVLGGAWSTGRSEVNGQVAAWEKSSRKTNSIGFRVVRSLP